MKEKRTCSISVLSDFVSWRSEDRKMGDYGKRDEEIVIHHRMRKYRTGKVDINLNGLKCVFSLFSLPFDCDTLLFSSLSLSSRSVEDVEEEAEARAGVGAEVEAVTGAEGTETETE